MGLKVGELFASLRLDDKDFDRGVDKAGSRFGGLAAGVAKGGLIIGGALAGIGVASGVMAAGFETDMANVGTLLGKDGVQRVEELGQSVKGLSMETGKPLDDLAGGLYQVVSAFGDTAESAEILRIAAQSSTAGLATTTDSVNLLSAVTKGYGDTSATAVRKASDLAFQTVKLGQTTFPELAASMGQVIPLAATLGVKEEELFGAMATLTGVTGNTAAVTTQLRAANQALINTNPKMLEQLKAIGFANGEAAIESLGFQGTLDALAGSVDGDSKKLAEMFGSVEALGAVLALTGAQSADFTKKTAAMGQATGATSEAFEIQQGTVSSMMERVTAAAGVLMVNLGEKLLPMFQSILQWVLDNWDDIAAVFDEVFATVGDVITWFVDNVWPMLLNNFTFLVEEVIPPLVAAIMWLAEEIIPALAGTVTETAEGVMPMLAAAFSFIAEEIIPLLAAAFTFIAEEILPRLQAVFAAVVEWIVANWPNISSIVGQVAGAVGTAFGLIAGVIEAVWPIIEAIASVLFPVVGAAATILLAALETTFNAIGGVFEVVGGTARHVFTAMTRLWGGLSGFFEGIWSGVGGAFKGGINVVIGLVNGLIGFLNNLRIDIPRVTIPGTDIGIGGGSIDPFNIGRIPYLAKGGRILRDGLAIVGDEGPELMHMRAGAEVVPLDRAGGGGNVTVQMTVQPRAAVDAYDIGLEARRAVRLGLRRRASLRGAPA
jgi:TP901 family phage tail tape measure protein